VRIIVTGGLSYGRPFDARTLRPRPGYEAEQRHLVQTLSALHRRAPIAVLVQGGAEGADELARDWADGEGLEVETFEAAEPGPGLPAWAALRGRNRRMCEAGGDLVVAFPGGSGTAHCLECARELGIPIVRAGGPGGMNRG
jgi:YspA, cpYpsA-related SLOG family